MLEDKAATYQQFFRNSDIFVARVVVPLQSLGDWVPLVLEIPAGCSQSMGAQTQEFLLDNTGVGF